MSTHHPFAPILYEKKIATHPFLVVKVKKNNKHTEDIRSAIDNFEGSTMTKDLYTY